MLLKLFLAVGLCAVLFSGVMLRVVRGRGDMVTCPFCKELIRKDATVCKHCKRDCRS